MLILMDHGFCKFYVVLVQNLHVTLESGNISRCCSSKKWFWNFSNEIKKSSFDLDETIYYCVGGIWIVGMRSWIWWTVNTGHTLHLEEIQRFDYVTWGLTLWQYYNTACRLIISLAEELECVDPVFLSEVHFIGLFEQYSIVDFLDVLIWSGGNADRN